MNLKNFFSNFSKRNQAAANDSSLSEHEIQQAIRELRSLSPRELDDIGLGYGNIEQAVRHGRPGFDRPRAA